MKDELTKKYKELIKEPFVFKELQAVNHRPHPYTVGARHVSYASDNCGGILDERTMKAVACAHPRCTLPYEDHKADNVCFVQLTRNCTPDEAKEVLQPVADECEKDGIDGFAFVETPEHFRVTEEER